MKTTALTSISHNSPWRWTSGVVPQTQNSPESQAKNPSNEIWGLLLREMSVRKFYISPRVLWVGLGGKRALFRWKGGKKKEQPKPGSRCLTEQSLLFGDGAVNSSTKESPVGIRGLSPRPGAESHGNFQVCARARASDQSLEAPFAVAATHLWDVTLTRSSWPSSRAPEVCVQSGARMRRKPSGQAGWEAWRDERAGGEQTTTGKKYPLLQCTLKAKPLCAEETRRRLQVVSPARRRART